jgi:hypothetical protein
MSDAIKHECGIAFLRLKKPLQFYKEKYGSAFYGIQKMYLLMEKQHNRGQDGAGFASIKLDMEPGERYIVAFVPMIRSQFKMYLLKSMTASIWKWSNILNMQRMSPFRKPIFPILVNCF